MKLTNKVPKSDTLNVYTMNLSGMFLLKYNQDSLIRTDSESSFYSTDYFVRSIEN
jgi:hypothetical protein